MLEPVVIIEQHRLLRDNLTQLLELDGFAVYGTTSGIDGLNIARRVQPACIITDYDLPDMNGLHVLQALRAETNTMTVPVIVLSDYLDGRLGQDAMRYDENLYLIESVEIDNLLGLTQRLITVWHEETN